MVIASRFLIGAPMGSGTSWRLLFRQAYSPAVGGGGHLRLKVVGVRSSRTIARF